VSLGHPQNVLHGLPALLCRILTILNTYLELLPQQNARHTVS
jgi:hypothetical protein